MILTGEKALPFSAQAIYPRLVDMAFLVDCLPDLHAIRSVQVDRAEAVLRPGFSFARSEMQLTIEKEQATGSNSAQFTFTTKGIGSSSLVAAKFELVDQADKCVIQWTAEVQQLGGLLKAVPKGLIQAGAERVINDLLTRIEQRLAV